jgi:nicotinate-nucleotide adenylyltransferase
MKERIGLFGGTFNPIHLGHLQAAEEVRAAFRLAKVLFIPSSIPPHKASAEVASAVDRLRMVELACAGHEGFVPSSLEVDAREKSYSVLTLAKVRELFPDAWIFFIVGADTFLEIGTWREYERVLGECLFVVTTRPGFNLEAAAGVLDGRLRDRIYRVMDGERPDEALFSRFGIFLVPIRALEISSTDVRERVRLGRDLEGLVPGSVADYIRDHQLYVGR